MGKIVAIGGGEIYWGETRAIDEYIVRLSGKPSPRLLFIPTASGDTESYIDVVKRVYGELGCTVDALCLIRESYTDAEIRGKIFSADIIYVGGGDTETMMKKWAEFSVDTYLREAYQRGIILSGLSAGSDCWFIAGYSDSEFFTGITDPAYKWVRGLGLLPFLHTPHYNEPERKGFDAYFAGQITDAIALDNSTAFVEIDGQYSVVHANDTGKAYYLTWNGKSVEKREFEHLERPFRLFSTRGEE